MTRTTDEERQQELRHRTLPVLGDDEDLSQVESKSPGVRRMEAINSVWTFRNKVFFIVALVVLTSSVMRTYQQLALNEFGESGNAGLVGTVRQVLTSASLPITAKMADYIGRGFILNCTVLFWIVGGIVTATSHNLGSYLPGFLLYTLGHVAGNVMNYALSIDTTSLRNRLFLQFCFVFPSIINVWAGGSIAESVDEGPGWRWGVGMWAIIIPPIALGLYAVFAHGFLKARKAGLLDSIPSAWRLLRSGKAWKHLFWMMDVIGLTLLAAALALILLPLSLGGSSAEAWKTPRVLTPLCIGILLLPAFAVWEARYARHPIFPFPVMKDRHVIVILLIHFLNSIATSTRDAYLYTTLVVSFNQSVAGATRINSISGCASSVTVFVVAFLIRRFRLVKPVVIAGVILVTVAQGLHVQFRGGYSTSQLAGIIAGELLEGIGSGMSGHPSLVAMQAKLSHEHALLITSCWAVGSQAGGGVASAVSGAVWKSLLPGKLQRGLEAAGVPDAKKLSMSIFRKPLDFAKTNVPGDAARDAVLFAYRDVQRTLSIIGLAISVVPILLSIFMDNVRLDDRKTIVDSDSEDDLTVRESSPDAPGGKDVAGEKDVKRAASAQ